MKKVDLNQRSKFERRISGALRSAIDAHGPITPKWIGSAAKRVVSAVKVWNRDMTKKMSNENCLEGIQCPVCDNEDKFFVSGHTTFELTDDGTAQDGDSEYGDEDMAQCPDCDFKAPWRIFHKEQHRRMGYDVWDRMSDDDKAAYHKAFDIKPGPEQLAPYYGDRVEVVTHYGEKRRFWVGKSLGYSPCYLEISRRDSSGGISCDSDGYKSVKLVRKGPRQ